MKKGIRTKNSIVNHNHKTILLENRLESCWLRDKYWNKNSFAYWKKFYKWRHIFFGASFFLYIQKDFVLFVLLFILITLIFTRNSVFSSSVLRFNSFTSRYEIHLYNFFSTIRLNFVKFYFEGNFLCVKKYNFSFTKSFFCFLLQIYAHSFYMVCCQSIRGFRLNFMEISLATNRRRSINANRSAVMSI